MILSVYLSKDIHDILSCYGHLDDVVNRILKAGSEGLIDIMNKPSAPEKKRGSNYEIHIEEPDYIQLLETYGVKSSKISLRRLLYWFVENEIYEELGWEISDSYSNHRNTKEYKTIIELKQALYNARIYLPEIRDSIDEFRNLIIETEDKIWYAT